MAQLQNKFDFQIPTFIQEKLETGKVQLGKFEAQAQDLLKDLYTRGNAELETLRGRLPVNELKAKLNVDELTAKAKGFESATRTKGEELLGELEKKVALLQEQATTLASPAAKARIEKLVVSLEELKGKVEGFVGNVINTEAKAAPVKKTAPKKAAPKKAAPKKAAPKKAAPKKAAKKVEAKA